MKSKKPNFFIVGAPRCGTTAMYEYLKAHPDIFMPEHPKEPHHFGSDLQGIRFLRFRDDAKYLALFDAAKDEKCLGEASTAYLVSKRAAYEIGEFNPSAKVIIMLRSPIDMIYSIYNRNLYTSNEDLQTFEEALAAEQDRRAGKRIPKITHTLQGLFYTEFGRFTEQIQRYFDVFGREQVHIIIYDDFKSDTITAYRETLNFLEVDSAFESEFRVVNANKTIKHKTIQQLLIKTNLTPIKIKESKTFHTIRTALPKGTIDFGIKLFNNLYTQEEQRTPMKQETEQKLKQQFKNEIDTLSQLINHNLTNWYK